MSANASRTSCRRHQIQTHGAELGLVLHLRGRQLGGDGEANDRRERGRIIRRSGEAPHRRRHRERVEHVPCLFLGQPGVTAIGQRLAAD